MGDLPALNPALTRKVWERMTHPSTRRVAARLQRGMPVSHQTIHRWRRNRWQPVERTEDPIELLRRQLDNVTPLLTGDPMSTVESLAKSNAQGAEIEQLPDRAFCIGRRALSVDANLVGEAVVRQPEIMLNKPGEVAVLVRALPSCLEAMSTPFAQVSKLKTAQPETTK